MRITTAHSFESRFSSTHPKRYITAIIALLVLVGWLDHATGNLPFQHLYYIPIILSAIRFGKAGALSTALASILLYHLANPSLMHLQHTEGDIVQMILFLSIGMVSAKLTDDAKRMHELATTDDLTGLHNLRSFEKQLERLITQAQVNRSPLSLLVLDVDRLKSMNDCFGHLAGAETVRTVGHVIAAQIPVSAVACRYGGDEFVIALPEHSLNQAMDFASVLCQIVNQVEPVLASRSFSAGTLSISVGVAEFTFEQGAVAQLGENLFRAADRALYYAKEKGRNRVEVFRDEQY